MAMATIETDDMDRYLEILRTDASQLDVLAKDLLINVTSFFRDPKVFDLLAETIIPDLVRDHSPDRPLRIWIAGCSTGEETYSLAMLFHEQIAATKRNIKLQVFASDVDPDAVASARDGLYPATIEAEVSPERLTRFFSKEDRGYRVLPELRAAVVFTVQDVLADPRSPVSIWFHAAIFSSIYFPRRRRGLSHSSILHCARVAFSCSAVRRRWSTPMAALKRSPSRRASTATSVTAGRANSAFR
jgi:chemotaxis methyl-accepting protein methylase